MSTAVRHRICAKLPTTKTPDFGHLSLLLRSLPRNAYYSPRPVLLAAKLAENKTTLHMDINKTSFSPSGPVVSIRPELMPDFEHPSAKGSYRIWAKRPIQPRVGEPDSLKRPSPPLAP